MHTSPTQEEGNDIGPGPDFMTLIKRWLEPYLRDPNQMIARVGIAVISYVFLGFAPVFLILVYMAHYGFFSYEYFDVGAFSQEVTFWTSALSVVVAAVVLTGGIIAIVGAPDKPSSSPFWPLVWLNLLVLSLTGIAVWSTCDPNVFAHILGVYVIWR